jgi:hypothetical protein
MPIVLAADLLKKQIAVLIHDEDMHDAKARAEAQHIAARHLAHRAIIGIDASNHHRARLGSHRPRRAWHYTPTGRLVESAIDRKSTAGSGSDSGSAPPVSFLIVSAQDQ